ncbi:hypothetical protein B0J14DRAFT_686512 [Halenospora varia]|nr:hypothetical protein B0J14DRAFT_686512 [Halenospora varia]
MDRISLIKRLRIPDLDDVFQFKLCVLQHGNTKKWETLYLIPHMHREQPRKSENNQDIKSENLPLRWHMPKITNFDPLASPQDQLRPRLDRRTRRLARIEPLGIRVDYALVPNKASNSLRIVFSSHIKFNDGIQELVSGEQLFMMAFDAFRKMEELWDYHNVPKDLRAGAMTLLLVNDEIYLSSSQRGSFMESLCQNERGFSHWRGIASLPTGVSQHGR